MHRQLLDPLDLALGSGLVVDAHPLGHAVDAEDSSGVAQVGYIAHSSRAFLPHECQAAGTASVARSHQLQLVVSLRQRTRNRSLYVPLFFIDLALQNLPTCMCTVGIT
jgi:hypothetical protein